MSRREDLTALVGTRICHDLVNPLGAISNGVELMGLAGASRTPELELIEESVQSASARIKFFRLAYGSGDDAQLMGRSDIITTLQAVARSGRTSFFWSVQGDQPRGRVRTTFLLLQCMESAMPMGGEVRITEAPRGAWDVTAEAERFIIDEPLWDSLSNPRARVKVSAAQVQFALLAEDLATTGARMALKLSPTKIGARF